MVLFLLWKSTKSTFVIYWKVANNFISIRTVCATNHKIYPVPQFGADVAATQSYKAPNPPGVCPSRQTTAFVKETAKSKWFTKSWRTGLMSLTIPKI